MKMPKADNESCGIEKKNPKNIKCLVESTVKNITKKKELEWCNNSQKAREMIKKNKWQTEQVLHKIEEKYTSNEVFKRTIPKKADKNIKQNIWDNA